MKKITTDKKQIAYSRLKEFILDYRVGPGQRLEHEYLSRLIGVSHTPIREALNQLLEEGYVYQIKNRGYFVCELSFEEILELYEYFTNGHSLSLSSKLGLHTHHGFISRNNFIANLHH